VQVILTLHVPIYCILPVVTVIGYGTDEATGMDYWLIKNHWGKDWGENGMPEWISQSHRHLKFSGYARVARNMGNHCLIANWVNYPLF
jgi:C1A family cysteine protease